MKYSKFKNKTNKAPLTFILLSILLIYFLPATKTVTVVNASTPSLNLDNTNLNLYDKIQDKDFDEIINKTQTLAISAIDKELKVESLIEREEHIKEIQDQNKMLKELEDAEKQKELINRQMEIKRKQGIIMSKKVELQRKVEEIKEQVQDQILRVRNSLKERLLKKRKDEQRRKELYKQKILSIKKEISSQLLKASKEGNIDNCNPNVPSSTIIDYCKGAFPLLSKQKECVNYDNFCFICCENEFGELHLESRVECNGNCEKFYSQKEKMKKESKEEKEAKVIKEQEPKTELKEKEKEFKKDLTEEINKVKKKEILKSIKYDLLN